MYGLFSQMAGHGVRTSVTNSFGYVWCKSRTAAVSMTMSPGDWRFGRICHGAGRAWWLPAGANRRTGKLIPITNSFTVWGAPVLRGRRMLGNGGMHGFNWINNREAIFLLWFK